LKDQVLHKAYGGEFVSENEVIEEEEQPFKKLKLVMHKDETLMNRDKFQLQVRPNPGKMLNMGYDKRCIVTPSVPLEEVTEVTTLPFGHIGTVERTISSVPLKAIRLLHIFVVFCNLFLLNL
jgi:hypothetical protein